MYNTTNKLYVQYIKQTVYNIQQAQTLCTVQQTNCMYSTTNILYVQYNRHKLYVQYNKQTVYTLQQTQSVFRIKQTNTMYNTKTNCMFCTTNQTVRKIQQTNSM